MTGPEHYAEAERLAELALSPAGLDMAQDGYNVAGAAQVHATLALTAAIAVTQLPYVDGFECLADRDYAGWGHAVGAE